MSTNKLQVVLNLNRKIDYMNKTTKKIYLPICKPPISFDAGDAYQLSIIIGNNGRLDWYYESYIQLCGVRWITQEIEQNNNIVMLYYNYPLLNDVSSYTNLIAENLYCPMLDSYVIPHEVISCENNISDFFCDLIAKGFYIFLTLDMHYIKAYNYTKHANHAPMIYGYDKDNRTFSIMDFFTKIDTRVCSFEEIENAYNSSLKLYSWIKGINAIKYKDIEYKFSIERFKMQIREYLNPHLFYEHSNIFYNENRCRFYWGINTYDIFITMIDNLLNQDTSMKTLPVKNMHLLYDHKVSMLSKIEYLHENGYIKDEMSWELIKKTYNGIIEKVLVTRNRMIKYHINSTQRDLQKTIQDINQIKSNEISVLEKLLYII